jgi:hypothetical protein
MIAHEAYIHSPVRKYFQAQNQGNCRCFSQTPLTSEEIFCMINVGYTIKYTKGGAGSEGIEP